MKTALFGLTKTEIEAIVAAENFPKYVAGQIIDWLYKKDIRSIDEMTNLSKSIRSILNEKYIMGLSEFIKVSESADGTKKYLFPTTVGGFIEAAYIPDNERATLCVSSQVGCKMGCVFCMTAKQGFQGQLTVTEILNQIKSLPERSGLTNVVYMGMGEPFDNIDAVLKSIEILTADYGYAWSPKRITVSTIGVIPAMKRFLEESKAHLAVSLHSPFEADRRVLMPIETKYPLKAVLTEIRNWDFGRQRRVSFEYIMFKDFNDTPAHAKELIRLLNGIKSRINLIRFHPIPGITLQSSSDDNILKFQELLKSKGIITTLRASRGQDIDAACGLLSTKELVKKKSE